MTRTAFKKVILKFKEVRYVLNKLNTGWEFIDSGLFLFKNKIDIQFAKHHCYIYII